MSERVKTLNFIPVQERMQATNTRYDELMRAGKRAYTLGYNHKAHQIWQRAAMLRPGSEEVWIALLSVLESSEDRPVCLQNILAINPNNAMAKHELAEYGAETVESTVIQPIRPPRRYHPLEHILMWLYVAFLWAIVIAVYVYGLIPYYLSRF